MRRCYTKDGTEGRGAECCPAFLRTYQIKMKGEVVVYGKGAESG